MGPTISFLIKALVNIRYMLFYDVVIWQGKQSAGGRTERTPSSDMYFIFLMVVCLKLVISQTRVYSIYPIFDQKMLTGHLLAEVDADSLSVCSAMCRNDCSCFGFNPQIKSCRLHKFCDLANMSPAESAWRYYYSSGR